VRALQEAFRERDFGKHTLSLYERHWKKYFEKELRSGFLIRKVFSQMQDRHINALFKTALTDGVMDVVYKKARFDWHSDLVFSLFRHSLMRNFFRRFLPSTHRNQNNATRQHSSHQ
jgi:flavin-dependent dehydrogenase